MSRTVILARHGRAEEKATNQDDKERSLTTEGMQNVSLMGDHLYHKKVLPDLIVSSDALRAQQTARLLAEQLKYPTDRIHISESIYNGTVRELLKLINQLDEQFKLVMIIGHNPTILYLTEFLTNAEIDSITTCGIVFIKFKLKTWSEITENSGTLEDYVHPELVNSLNRE